ncbi:hypothetical protein D0Z03_002294 [Geotrichum reessii]|nr:hypothetical protein D0Z03_002294 [Galactomyces reessii]
MKDLGAGRETKRQKFEEALLLEQTGRGNDETKSILYEERTVKNWEDDEDIRKIFKPTEAPTENFEDEDLEEKSTSVFIDYRPKAPVGTGFGFSNIPTVAKVKSTSYNWRAKLAAAKAKKHGIDLAEIDGETSSEDEQVASDSEDPSSQSGSEEEEEDDEQVSSDEQEEWTGFDDASVKTDVSQVKDEEDGSEEEEEEDEENEEEDEENEVESEENKEESEDEDDASDDDNEEENDPFTEKKTKGQIFNDWAKSQNDEQPLNLEIPKYEGTYVPIDRSEDTEALPVDYANPHLKNDRKAFFVNVNRSEEVQAIRLKLPVVAEEQRIMEAIHNNDCVVICGETGSGKTTQVPQFLFESGYGNPDSDNPGMIGITQPRRVAAVSMAKRVTEELGDKGHVVGYQIRFDANVKNDTAIKFMTDGVLLRELSNDFALTKYSAIVIDEAHERNVNTDILIGVLSRILKLRREMATENPGKVKPLKLIIMSATLRVSDFTENTTLFDVPPPVLKVDARQYPVSVHFNKKTPFNYLDEVYRKTCKIHQKLPPGGILIFLTGQNEITNMCKRLRKTFPFKKKSFESKKETEISVRVNSKDATTEVEDIDFGIEIDENEVDDFDVAEEEEDEEGFDETLEEGQDANAPLHVLPLYSLLPTKEQMKVFDEPPAGSRLCVVATNVAETSLTIPGIRYVVDCGRSKERVYDEETGVQQFTVNWISKASSGQRSGRAGRTGPGHCYRIFSSAVYERDFDQFSKPEILRMPIDGLVLQMKAMGIDKIVNFPFPTPPDRTALQKGLNLLKYLGALDEKENLSNLGRSMSLFPLSPRFAKMLIIGDQLECLPYIVAIVAGLSVGDPFIGQHELGIAKKPEISAPKSNEERDDYDDQLEEEQESVEDKEFKRQMRADYHKVHAKFSSLDSKSDALKLLCAVCAYDFTKTKEEFSKSHYLRYKIMEEIKKLRGQVSYIVAVNTKSDAVDSTVSKLSTKLKPPTATQVKAIKQMISAGFLDQIAVRADLIRTDLPLRSKTKIIAFPYMTLFPSRLRTSAYEDLDPFVYIHPGSVLTEAGSVPPDYLVFNSLQVSQNNSNTEEVDANGNPVLGKIRMKVLCDITPSQLTNVAKESSLITYSKPLGPPYAPKMISTTKRECWVIPRMGAAIGTGGVGWDLPVKKVIQIKEGVHWVVPK